MSESTLANKSPGSIFNFGSILDRVTSVGVDALQQVAPVWLAEELNLNAAMPVAVNPTYQNTDSQRQPAAGLTTNEGGAVNNTEFVVKQSTVLLVGVAALAVLLLVRDRQ